MVVRPERLGRVNGSFSESTTSSYLFCPLVHTICRWRWRKCEGERNSSVFDCIASCECQVIRAEKPLVLFCRMTPHHLTLSILSCQLLNSVIATNATFFESSALKYYDQAKWRRPYFCVSFMASRYVTPLTLNPSLKNYSGRWWHLWRIPRAPSRPCQSWSS